MPHTDRSCREVVASRGRGRESGAMNWALIVFAAGGGIGVGWLGGRALECAHPPAPLPKGWCEAGTGALCALVSGCLTWHDSSPAAAPVPLAVAALAVPLTLSDLRYRRLPNPLTLSAYPLLAVAVAVTALAGADSGVAVRALVAAVLFGGTHAALHALAPTAMGMGDVKLAGSVGAALGVSGWFALPAAAIVAALVSLSLSGVAVCRGTCRDGVPYGPGLLTGTVVVSVLASVA